MDTGTENGTVAKVQRVLTDDDSSVIIGESTANVRIDNMSSLYSVLWRTIKTTPTNPH